MGFHENGKESRLVGRSAKSEKFPEKGKICRLPIGIIGLGLGTWIVVRKRKIEYAK
jgi:hypothetical protein